MEELKQAWDQVQQKIEAVQKVMKLRNKGNKSFKPYKEGNQVWIEGTNLKIIYPTAKLGSKRYGDTPSTPLAVEPRLFAVLVAGPSTPEGHLLPVPAGR